jgi:AcrR family transcriptional regulator
MPKISPQAIGRRKELLETAALKCFLRRGYHGTTVRDVAVAARVSLGGIYAHYPDKLSLYEAVMERLSRGFLEADSGLRRYLMRSRFPADLPQLADALAADTERFRDYFKMAYLDVVEFDGKHIHSVFSDLEEKFRNALGPRLRAPGTLGRRHVDPAFAFVAIYLQLYQYFQLTRMFDAQRVYGRRSDRQVVRELIDLYLGGLS